jgi:hypothetical protein
VSTSGQALSKTGRALVEIKRAKNHNNILASIHTTVRRIPDIEETDKLGKEAYKLPDTLERIIEQAKAFGTEQMKSLNPRSA